MQTETLENRVAKVAVSLSRQRRWLAFVVSLR